MTETSSAEKRQEEQDVFFGVINRFIALFTHEAQRSTQNDTSREYPFVPMDTRQIYAQLLFVRDYLRRHNPDARFSLIDIGCGIGNVLLFGEQLNFQIFGIEKDPVPCATARQLLGEDTVQALDIWDFNNYDNFDVIYYFRPFHRGDIQRKFEHLVEQQMRKGAILVANRKMSDAIETAPHFQRLHPDMPIWEKIQDQKEDPPDHHPGRREP